MKKILFILLILMVVFPSTTYATRLWSDGFELGTTSGNFGCGALGVAMTLETTTKHGGDYSAKLTGLSSGTPQGCAQTFTSAAGTNGPVYIRVYLNLSTAPSAENYFLTFQNGNALLAGITLNSSGALTLRDEDGTIGSASSALTTNTWYRVELMVDRTAAAGSHIVRGYIDGTQFAGAVNRSLSVMLDNFRIGGNIASEAQTQGVWYMDDFAINDSSGTNQTSLPGSGSIINMQPNAAGDNNGCLSGDYTSVDELTPDDATTLCVVNDDGDILDVNVESSASAGLSSSATITLVQVGAREAAASAAAEAWNLRIKSASTATVFSGTTNTHDDTVYKTNGDALPRNYTLTSYTDPTTTSAWTPTGTNSLDNMQIGIIGTDTAPDINLSTLWALVEYVPDTTLPTITSVSSDKTNGSYTVGEVIDIDVTFSETVTSTGSVTVTLETGATDRTCTFTVTSASTGTCNYTVQSGDTSSDLDIASISGTIADTSGNVMTNFVPATSLAANKAIVIDTTAPSTTGTPDLTAGTDSGISSIDDITSDATPDFTISCEDGATVTLKEGITSLGAGSCSSSTVTITSSSLSDGVYSIKATQADTAGNVSSDSSTLTVTIDTSAPSVSITAPTDLAVVSGASVSITANASDTTGVVGVQFKLDGVDQDVEDTTAPYSITWDSTAVADGTHAITAVSRDAAGNSTTSATINVTVDNTAPSSGGGSSGGSRKKVPAPQAPEVIIPPPSFLPPITKVIEKITPSFLKPKPEEPVAIPIENSIEEITPLAFQGLWNLLPEKPIDSFVFAPLPTELQILATKFPELEKTLNEIGVQKLSDLSKIKGTTFKLPGITDKTTTPTPDLAVEKFALPSGIPLAEIPTSMKKDLPSEFIFARATKELLDIDVEISIDNEGGLTQEISTLSGKPLRLVMKPDGPVNSVKGYLAFKSATPRVTNKMEISRVSLLASPIFSTPKLAREFTEEAVPIEEKFVVNEFEYTDADGDGIYTADIITPVVAGTYEVITIIDYIDPAVGRKQIRLTTVIDPEGYIYEKTGNKETRIPEAVVSIFRLNPVDDQYELWPAKQYQQTNPQTTDVRGTYSFLVPEGTYYISVEAPGYKIYKGKSFIVSSGKGVHTNIELQPEHNTLSILEDWKTLVLIIVIILLAFNFYRDRNRQKLIN